MKQINKNSFLPKTLLENLLLKFSISSPVIVILLFFSIFVLLFIASYLDNNWDQFHGTNIKWNFLTPVIIGSIILLQPLLEYMRNEAIKAFQQISLMNPAEFYNCILKAPSFQRKNEWLAVIAGIFLGILIMRPWTEEGILYLSIYNWIIIAILFSIIGWFVYSAIAGTMLFKSIQHKPLKMNLFDPSALQSVTNWSMTVSLSCIGLITLSSFLIDGESLFAIETILIFSFITLVAILVFFLNLYVTHKIIRLAKKTELRLLRKNLNEYYQKIKNVLEKGVLQEKNLDRNSINVLSTYEQRIKEVPEWPYTFDVMRNLFLSILLPSGIWIFRILMMSKTFNVNFL